MLFAFMLDHPQVLDPTTAHKHAVLVTRVCHTQTSHSWIEMLSERPWVCLWHPQIALRARVALTERSGDVVIACGPVRANSSHQARIGHQLMFDPLQREVLMMRVYFYFF